MKNNVLKTIALLLTVFMLFSVMAVAALAEESEGNGLNRSLDITGNSDADSNGDGALETEPESGKYTVSYVLSGAYTDAGFLSNAGGGLLGDGAVYSFEVSTERKINAFGVVFTTNDGEIVKNVVMTLINEVATENKGSFAAGTQVSTFDGSNSKVDYSIGFGHANFASGTVVYILVTPQVVIDNSEVEDDGENEEKDGNGEDENADDGNSENIIPDFPIYIPQPIIPETSEPSEEPEPEEDEGGKVQIPDEEVPGGDTPEDGGESVDAPESDPEQAPPVPAPAPAPTTAVSGNGLTDIADEDVPLGDLPQTGDNGVLIYLLILVASGLAAGAVVLTGRKSSAR